MITEQDSAANFSHNAVAIVDFGSQFTQLIARRVREHGVFCRIYPCTTSVEEIVSLSAVGPGGSTGGDGLATSLKGIILSGGPRSVYAADAVAVQPELLEAGVPVLGICYGLQATIQLLGGGVDRGSGGGEYGRTEFKTDALPGVPPSSVVWMSHGDQVVRLPDGFRTLGSSESCPFAAVEGLDGRFLGLQFHPEVSHTEYGSAILKYFLHDLCGAEQSWEMGTFLEDATATVRRQVGENPVICGLSGGVDSSTLAVLLHRALGERLTCIFVDNGLLRKGEAQQVQDTFGSSFGIRLRHVDAADEFLSALAGVEDPEEKRRRIGELFIEIFSREARALGGAGFLAQGTLYPDVIESVAAHGGPTATIKTHHNVGGLPDDLKFELVEPFRELFKDEVRELGRRLGLSEDIVARHPFPGPGLAVRIPGEVTRKKLSVLREADAIFRHELTESGWMARTSQAFCVLLPVRTVGVMGDERTYENVLALRCVDTTDFMTADWSRLPSDLLAKVSSRIINEVAGINRVVYDISSKPPATIEWE
ncbi:MAG: glutamine-hydrolyzing GMP synthase [Planctomycetota bacterium]|nr:glutamine-hydrolyzing GMP synthase [Planctomycetota bacterium]